MLADCIVDTAVESMCAKYFQHNEIGCCLAVAAGNCIDFGPDAVGHYIYFHFDFDPGSAGELTAHAL